MQLNSEEVQLNERGTLTEAQLKKIRRKGIAQMVAGIIFLVLAPASVLMAHIHWGAMVIIWLLFGLLFAGVFIWSAWGYLKIKPEGNAILNVSGKVSTKSSGNKHTLITVGERSFLMMKNEASTLVNDRDYTLYYLEDPKMVVGWTVGSAQ